jgi:UDP-N-acetylmuramyl tripeptide synthase
VGLRVAGEALGEIEPAWGRGQVIDYQGRRVRLVLVKNPAGFNQAIRLLGDAPSGSAVLIAINDNIADGRDVSWLWDARVEDLADTGHRLATAGIRADDMALRLKYAGVPAAWAESDFDEALRRVVAASAPGDTVYVVPTYTAMLALLERLLPETHRKEAWT